MALTGDFAGEIQTPSIEPAGYAVWRVEPKVFRDSPLIIPGIAVASLHVKAAKRGCFMRVCQLCKSSNQQLTWNQQLVDERIPLPPPYPEWHICVFASSPSEWVSKPVRFLTKVGLILDEFAGPFFWTVIIEQRLFQVGSDVSAGQVLYVLDQRPYEADVAKAKGDLEQSQANHEFARNQAALLQANADLKQAEANLFKTRQDVERLKPLVVKEEAAPQQDLDDALAALQANEANVNSRIAAADERR